VSPVLRDRLAGDPMTPARRQLESTLESGMVAGIASAVVTAGLLALGGALAGVGPYAPFYAIVSVLDPGALQVAQSEIDQGVEVSYFQQQFVGGLGICLVLGAVSGVVFALGSLRYRLTGRVRYLVGAIHGVQMMCLFYVVALQTVGALLDISADTSSLSRLIGWPALVLVHAVHGIVVAAVLRTRLASNGNVFAALGGGPPRG
jgi:hypothetical protein